LPAVQQIISNITPMVPTDRSVGMLNIIAPLFRSVKKKEN